MSDFIAGYISGGASILLGSPLDILKARLQSSSITPSTTFTSLPSLLHGTLPPLITNGLLNALLFSTYTRALPLLPTPSPFLAGTLAGLVTASISAPTEIIKLRQQLTGQRGVAVVRSLLRAHGPRGLFIGFRVTALRDAVGYGWYFSSYEAVRGVVGDGAAGVLVAGGVAGCVTWASVYPLDVIKTRVQAGEVLGGAWHGGLGAWECGKLAYAERGWRVFADGLGVCMARAFLVNAVQFFVYEFVMQRMRSGDEAGMTMEAL